MLSQVDSLATVTANVASAAQVDITRAYHFGARYNVEIEIILPGDMSVRESHDIALELQHKVRQESYPEFFVWIKNTFFFFHFCLSTSALSRYRYDQLMRLGWHVLMRQSGTVTLILCA